MSTEDMDLAENEATRLSKRAAIRRKICATEIAESRWRDLTDAIQRCESQKETLAAEHVTACQPIQRELADIERRQIDAAVQKQPRDAELEERRKALADQLREANVALESAIAHEDTLIGKLGIERREAGMASNAQALRSELLQSAPEALRIAVRVTSQRLMRYAARVDVVRKEIASTRKPSAYLLASLADAEQEENRARRESEEAVRLALDEGQD